METNTNEMNEIEHMYTQNKVLEECSRLVNQQPRVSDGAPPRPDGKVRVGVVFGTDSAPCGEEGGALPERNSDPSGELPGRLDAVDAIRKRPLQTGATTIVTCNAARERTRVKTLRSAFYDLQQALPCVPANTKLSKLDVLVLATMYIAHLMATLQQPAAKLNRHHIRPNTGRNLNLEYLHPVKKWPMRTRLYAGLAARARGSPGLDEMAGVHTEGLDELHHANMG